MQINKTLILQAFLRYLYNEKHLPMARAKAYRDAIDHGEKNAAAAALYRAFKKEHGELFEIV